MSVSEGCNCDRRCTHPRRKHYLELLLANGHWDLSSCTWWVSCPERWLEISSSSSKQFVTKRLLRRSFNLKTLRCLMRLSPLIIGSCNTRSSHFFWQKRPYSSWARSVRFYVRSFGKNCFWPLYVIIKINTKQNLIIRTMLPAASLKSRKSTRLESIRTTYKTRAVGL